MYTTMSILFLISFLIFFRNDVGKFIKKFEDYPYLVTTCILVVMNYFILLNLNSLQHFILIFGYFLLNLANKFLTLFSFLGVNNPGLWSRWFLKALTLGFLIFYPLYYQNKYKSSVYLSERISIRVIYFALTVFFYFFCLHFKI